MSAQTPRQIAFEDIRAGDRIRTEHPEGGVKFMCEGVAHQNTHDGWFTSEGGLIVSAHSTATITLLHRPAPAEPKGLGAVVRARVPASGGRLWTFVKVHVEQGLSPWQGPGAWRWSDFDPDSIEVLSEGIEVEP